MQCCRGNESITVQTSSERKRTWQALLAYTMVLIYYYQGHTCICVTGITRTKTAARLLLCETLVSHRNRRKYFARTYYCYIVSFIVTLWLEFSAGLQNSALGPLITSDGKTKCTKMCHIKMERNVHGDMVRKYPLPWLHLR